MACNFVEIDGCDQGSQRVGNACVPCGITGGNATTANPSNVPWWQVLLGALPGVATGASDVIDSIKGNEGNGGNGQPIIIQTPSPPAKANTGLVIGLVLVGVLALGTLLWVVTRQSKGKKA